MTRRELFARAALALPIWQTAAARSKMESILDRIRAPGFPHRDYDITHFGAVADGRTKCTEAIRKAVAACSAAGGGRVVVPRGSFLTGAIHLESGVNLHVSDGAALLFSRDPKDYLPVVYTRFESTECMNYSPFIYAFEKENIAVTGGGILDGQADLEHWWPWAREARGGARGMERASRSDVDTLVRQMGDRDVPVTDRVFGEGHFLRPNFVQPYRCKNVLLEGFTMKNSPMWELNPVLCRNVTVRSVTIDSQGPNNDGCDPECSRDVLIENCRFTTGDDCIAIKSGRNRDGRRVNVACENVLIRNCTMKDGHGGVAIGSEVSGGIRNVFVERCRMNSPHLQRALRIKTNSYRGGVITGVSLSQVEIDEVEDAVIAIDFYYEEAEGGMFKPVAKDILVQNVTCGRSKYALYLHGYADDPIKEVNVAHCRFQNTAQGNFLENVEKIQCEDVQVNGKSLA
jgi:polygalacturonase